MSRRFSAANVRANQPPRQGVRSTVGPLDTGRGGSLQGSAHWQQRTYALGCRAYPEVSLPYEAFAHAMQTRGEPLHAEDMFLATACDVRADGAWECLERRYTQPLRALMRRRGSTSRDTRELLSELWGALAVPPTSGNARTRLGTYDGRGSLFAWLATVTWRRSVDRWRRDSAGGTSEIDESVPARTKSHVSALMDAESERIVSEALASAWEAMTTRQLQVIVLKYRHGLPQRAIAKALRISPPRVTRILRAACEKLRVALGKRVSAEGLDVGRDWPGLVAALDLMLQRGAAELERDSRERDQ